MDLIEDEPRQHPKPVPFCQSSLSKPTVPEVSLLLQDNTSIQLEKKNDSFSGTEFQTYNSWRWKNIKENNMNVSNFDLMKVTDHFNGQNCYLIKDKYSASEIEKRKNEILYGESDEPRRPLPPRANSFIQTNTESFFHRLNSSFEDLKLIPSPKERQKKVSNSVQCKEKNMSLTYSNQACFIKELDISEKLHSIILEQNKQLHVLQNQIEQLLKLQEVKDKQIEQLLKSQESKEKKIEQLFHCLHLKDKEIDQFKNFKEKQEQEMQELVKSHENFQKENLNLVKKFNEMKKKDMHSVGVMANVQMVDANTCTSFEIIKEDCNKKIENTDEDISILRESSKIDEKDKSLSLHSSDLPIIQENAPTPQSSIHVDIQEFPDCSDDSDSETEVPSNSFSATKETQSNPLGYTFYNNVLSQLQDIIQNSGEKENKESNGKSESQEKVTNQVLTEYNLIMENRRPLHSWDVFEKENVTLLSNDQEKTERFSDKFRKFCFKETTSPSDISLKINALAVKYLKQEEISEFDLQAQIPTSCQHDVTIYNVTNLSFGSMRYLDRYKIFPKAEKNQKEMINVQKNEVPLRTSEELLCRKKKMTVQENATSSVGNILDISILNQQPKLL